MTSFLLRVPFKLKVKPPIINYMNKIFLPLVIGALFSLASFAKSGSKNDSCEEIKQVCLKAGFSKGAFSSGTGLKRHCIWPIISGTPANGATLPLPQISPKTVEKCKRSRPDFGKPKD